MTVSYAGEVPNGSSFGCFWKILWKWRGSVYKLVWRELLAYLALYYTINVMYRYVLTDDQKRIFEKIRQYFGAQSESIPMSFVLGFYVSLIVKRWWEQYKLLPWPDTLALFISAAIPGNNETGRLMRRNIMRYSVLAYVITLMRISLRVKRRFPSWQHLVDAGLMLESEKKIFEIMDGKSPMSKYWMPLVWATNIINRARKQEIIASDHIVQTLLVELSDIRRRLGALIGYDTVCVPLVYTQVVTLVLYTYFIAALLGRQMIPKFDGSTDKKYEDPDLYFPLFTALQFCFYVGWLKVAEVLINPFGEDDDDIELNWLIDRHIKASYMIVDEMHEEHPELLKDQYWEEVVPQELPYTVASEHYRRFEPKGSAETYKVKPADAMYANIISSKRQNFDDVYADYESVDTPMVQRRKNSNWFSRQLTRMGSMRSSSTAYSSNGLFKRNRHNSVYSSPESRVVLPGQQQQLGPPPAAQKMSFYDKLRGKSMRNQRQMLKRDSKISLNGAVISSVPLKNRPRIPTPDVSKEASEKENRFNLTPVTLSVTSAGTSGHLTSTTTNVASGVALMPQHLSTTYPNLNNDMPVTLGTFFLSPIKEQDSGSVHNTLQAGNPATAALAKAIIPATLQSNTDWRTVLASNQPMAQISLPISTATSSTNSIPVGSMVFPLDATMNNVAQTQGVLPVTITTVPVSLASYTTESKSGSPHQNSQHSSVVITELLSDRDSQDENESSSEMPMPLSMARRNSLSSTAMNASKELISRKVSDGSKSTDSPSLPKRNQPITSSAPSTLTKSKSEQKTGEVYV